MRVTRSRVDVLQGRVAALALVCSLVLQGCGYSLAGRGSFLPEYIETIGVPLFANNTRFFNVEQVLTQMVRSAFIGRGSYRVVPDEVGADAVLEGAITSIQIAPASFTDQQQASRYTITLQARITFRDLQADEVLWQDDGMVFTDEYEVATGGDALDPNAFFGQESNAIQRVAEDFAMTVVSSILEAF